ncbi:MAG: biotin-dependent carboxyltransferase family protein [Bacteroidota bacterium]
MPARSEILIKKAGLYTCIQDAGRMGYMDKGVARSGALDKQSFYLANWLVGNDQGEALLETTFQGLSVQFSCDCLIAVTGGDLGAKLNGKEIKLFSAIPVKAKDELIFSKRISGFRAYLAISGGIEQNHAMASRSAHSIFDLGIRQIKDDTKVEIGSSKKVTNRNAPPELVTTHTSHFTARIVPGPDFDLFPRKFRDEFSKSSMTVSPDSNRMGYRLKWNPGKYKLPEGIISSGVIPGTIQITSSGQPIILMHDGPTTGGYARIANVISSDLDHIAQLAPGDTIRFKWIDFDEADRRVGEYQRNLLLY